MGNELPTEESLYNIEITSSNSVPEGSKTLVRGILTKAKNTVKGELENAMLNYTKKSEHVEIVPIKPNDYGITFAYTDGYTKGVNAYILKGTRWYLDYLDRLKSRNTRVSRFLYNILSQPIKTLYKSFVHEELHDQTQIGTGFDKELYKATLNYIEKRLPRPLNRLAEPLANYFVTLMTEGANESATRQVTGDGKTVGEIKHKIENQPVKTSYDLFAQLSCESMQNSGIDKPLDLYARFRRGKEILGEYVSRFFKAYSKMTPQYAH